MTEPHLEASGEPSLYIVATPIGNLGDMTPRARQVLLQVDRVAAEDTRNTGRLLDALGIRKPLMAHHAHNEAQSAQGILECLRRGESVALVSDAGTPAVSDPGARVVKLVSEAGYKVVPLPGASSVLTILAASGLVDGEFAFRGFLPAKGRQRLEVLGRWLNSPEPQILFEAPHRIHQLMEDLLAALPDGRELCAGREMTKQFESFYRGSALQVKALLQEDPYAEKGEWAIVIGAAPDLELETAHESSAQVSVELRTLCEVLLKECSPRAVVNLVMELSGLPKKTVYPLVMALKEGAEDSEQ